MNRNPSDMGIAGVEPRHRWRGGAREGRVVTGGGCSEGWEAGRREDMGLILTVKRARGYFSTVPRGVGAPDRVLPRRGRCGSDDCLFGIQRAPTGFWACRWCTNLGSEPKICVGRVLGGVLGAPAPQHLGALTTRAASAAHRKATRAHDSMRPVLWLFGESAIIIF
jgi:hypothetical protein